MRAVIRVAALALCCPIPLWAASGEVQPFAGTYSVNWHGMNAGTTEIDLQRDGGAGYRYRSRANARGMFRAFFSDEITQTSWLELDDGVRPVRYRADDGSDDTERDVALDFDWISGRVTGTAERKPVSLPVAPGTQDAMSIQIAVMRDLARGTRPAIYVMIDKDRIKEYQYIFEGEAKLKTAIGELPTVVYRAERVGSSRRATRTWYAPSLGFVPVRAERLKEGKREWLMEVRSLKR